MSKSSVYIFNSVILSVTNLIHNQRAMYAVLDKDTIKTEIRPHLSVTKRVFVTLKATLLKS